MMTEKPEPEELTDEQRRALGEAYDLLRRVAAREQERERTEPTIRDQLPPGQRVAWDRLWEQLLRVDPADARSATTDDPFAAGCDCR